MKKEELKKLRELLAKEGIEESKVEYIVDELEADEDDVKEEEKKEKKDKEEHEEESDVEDVVDDKGEVAEENANPESVDETVNEIETKEEEVVDVPPVAVELPPETPKEEVKADELPEGVEEVNPLDVVNANQEGEEKVEEQPQQPQESPVDYQNKIDELNKVIEGLTSRIGSLEEALRKGGILTDEMPSDVGGVNPVGIDENQVPANADKEDSYNLDTIIGNINRRNRF